MINRRRFLKFSAIASGLGLGVGFYTWRCEPHWVEIVELPLPIKNLPAHLAGARLVQLSDLHIGPQVADAYLARTFEKVKQLEPEIVVYTGDFTSYEPKVLDHSARMFAHLPHGRQGTLGILGNHDYGPQWSHPEVASALAKAAGEAGVNILRNQVADVNGLQIVGLDDLWGRHLNLKGGLSGLRPQSAALVLSHNPDTVDLPGWESYSGWILAGHTHGGQCKPPFLSPPLLPVKNRRYVAGAYPLAGGRRLYINRGIGHLMQVRFNVRPEITVFHLEKA